MHELHFLTDAGLQGSTKCAIDRPAGHSRLPAHPRRVGRRDGPAGGFRRLRRGGLHPRHHGLDDGPQGRPGGRLRGRPARRARLRPAPRLPRARGVREPAGRARRAGARCSTASSRRRPTATTSWWRWCRRRLPAEVRAVLASGDTVVLTGDALKFAARNLTRQVAGGAAHPPGCRNSSVPGRQKSLDGRASAAGRGRLPRHLAARRRHPRADRGLRLRAQQVQPRDPGAAPAGLGVQA